MAAILFSIFEGQMSKIRKGIPDFRTQHPLNRLKRLDTDHYPKMLPTLRNIEIFSRLFRKYVGLHRVDISVELKP